MRHRRRGGLGGTPAQHKKAASKLAHKAFTEMKRAERYAESGQCSTAIPVLASAAEMMGKFKVHWAGAHGFYEEGVKIDTYFQGVIDGVAAACSRRGAFSGPRGRR